MLKKLIFIALLFLLIAGNSYGKMKLSSYPAYSVNVEGPLLATEALEDGELQSNSGSYFSFFSITSLFFLPDVWLFSIGDASIETIARQSGIKKIQHVDEQTSSIYFFVKWFETKTYTVYGYK